MARYPIIRGVKQMIEVAQLVLEENIEGCITCTFEEAGVSGHNGFVVEVDGRIFLFTVVESEAR